MNKVTFKGSAVSLDGKDVNIGEKAPQIALVGKDLAEFEVGGSAGKFQILLTVPSLDTGVCAAEARKFNEKMAGKTEVSVNIISMDLPFAMGRFCTTEGIENLRVGSDFRGMKFGKAYGVLLKDSALEGLLTRAVFVIDPDGILIYKELVSEITNEPNYDAIGEAIKATGNSSCSCNH